MRQALDKSVTDWIRIGDKYDGNGAGGLFGRLRAETGHRDNRVDFAFDEFLRKRTKSLRLPAGKRWSSSMFLPST